MIIFSGCTLLAFPANGKNPHKLPSPRWDAVARGGKVDDTHLAWTSKLSFVIRRGEQALGDDWLESGDDDDRFDNSRPE